MLVETEVSNFEHEVDWESAIQNRAQIYNGPAVYAIVSSAPFPRLNSQSRILYIGKTGSLGGTGDRCRLYAYRYAPSGQHGSRIRNSVASVIQIGHKITLKWKSLESEDEAQLHESRLLALYMEEHLEHPPFNRKS